MAFGTMSGGPVRSLAYGMVLVAGRFLGGGSATDMTKVSKTGRGITSVKTTSTAGEYDILLDGYAGTLQAIVSLNVLSATGAATQFVCRPISWTTSTRTIRVFITDVATPSGHDLATTEELHIVLAIAEHE